MPGLDGFGTAGTPKSAPVAARRRGASLQPPGNGPLRQLRQPLFHQPDVLVDVRLHDGLLAGREEFFDRRLLGAHELSEESPLRKKLVDQDGADRVGLLVRLEVQQGVRHRPPHAHRLVRFAGVGGQDVLEDRFDGRGYVGVGDGGEVIVHGRSSPYHIGGYPRWRRSRPICPACSISWWAHHSSASNFVFANGCGCDTG